MPAPKRVSGYYQPNEIVAKLAEMCPKLSQVDIARWAKPPRGLLTPAGIAKDGNLVALPEKYEGRPPSYLYTDEHVRFIHRLYHFEKIRNFDRPEYSSAATLRSHQPFVLYFYRNIDCVPEVPFHMVFKDAMAELDRKYSDIVIVRNTSPVFGGSVNGIALCEAYDDYDITLFSNHVTREIHAYGSCVTIQATKLTSSSSFFNYGEGSAMRAFVIISANNLGESERVFTLYDELKQLPQVVSASVVYGEAEIIALVEENDEQAMSDFIAGGLRTREGVTGTKTFIAVHGFNYDRECEK